MDEIDKLKQLLAFLLAEEEELRRQFDAAYDLHIAKFKQMVDVNNQIRELKESK